MPLDAITISALCDELRPQLEGARIDKVQSPGAGRRPALGAQPRQEPPPAHRGGRGERAASFHGGEHRKSRRAADVLHAAAQASDRREDRFDKPAGA